MASIYFSTYTLGNFSLIQSWLLISTPFVSAIGNIAFPSVARDFNLSKFELKDLYIYLCNALLISMFLTTLLALSTPFILDRLMTGVYQGYSSYVFEMAVLIVLKQVFSILSEIARGLDLNLLYSFVLFLSIAGSALGCVIVKPENPLSLLSIILIAQIFNLLICYVLVYRAVRIRSQK